MLPEFLLIATEDLQLDEKGDNGPRIKKLAKTMMENTADAESQVRLIFQQCKVLRERDAKYARLFTYCKTARAQIDGASKSKDLMLDMHWDKLQNLS